MSISLRPATTADAAAIGALGCRVFSATFGHTVTPEQLQDYLDEAYSIDAVTGDLTNPKKNTVVAVDEADTVLGFVLVTRGSESEEPCLAGVESVIELQRLYVDVSAHGRGIGKSLMQRAEGIARDEGYARMWLGVWEHNDAAQALYKKMGYSKVGNHNFIVGGDVQTDDILLKTL